MVHAAIIRPYRPSDLEPCRSLWAELVGWHRKIYQDPGIGGPEPGRYFDLHLERVGPEHIWVAQLGEQVVGFAGLIPGEDEAELEPLVVSEIFRGQGIGQQLAAMVIAAARSGGYRNLSVRPVARNACAIRFFHDIGFDILGQIELFMDFDSSGRQKWKQGEQVAGKEFRV